MLSMQKAECHLLACAHGVAARYMSGVAPLRRESQLISTCASTHPHLSRSCQFDIFKPLGYNLNKRTRCALGLGTLTS